MSDEKALRFKRKGGEERTDDLLARKNRKHEGSSKKDYKKTVSFIQT